MRFRTLTATLAVALMLVSACGRGGDDEATSTTAVSITTSSVAAGDTTTSTTAAVGDDSSTTAGTVVIGMPSYEVASRTEGDLGDQLVVVVEPGSYSNVELENMVFDLVDRFAPAEAIVVDTDEAVGLVGLEELTAEQQTFLAQHTVVRIDDGVEVTFLGPYADLPGLTIGS